MIYYPTSLFLEKKNEDGYFYIFIASEFENGVVKGRTYIPDVENEVYIFDSVVVRNVKDSTLNFEMVFTGNMNNKTISTENIFPNPYKEDTIH